MFGDGVEQGLLYVFGHARGVAAHVDVRALLQPLPQFGGFFADFVLHVDFLFLIARPGEVVFVEQAVFRPALPFGLVEEILGEVLVAENQPVFATVAVGGALLHEGAEGGDAGARADHDYGRFRVFR